MTALNVEPIRMTDAPAPVTSAATRYALPSRRRDRVFWLSVVVLVVIGLIGLVGPWLPGIDAKTQDLRARFTPPVWAEGGTWDHPLGTDQLGRDMLSQLVAGARLSLIIAVGAVVIAGVFGTVVGVVAGYYRGAVDMVISRLIDAQLAFPVLLLAIAIIAARGRSLAVLVVVLAVIGWSRYARLTRADAIALRERPFILGLRAAGLPPWRIIFRHVVPNLMNTVIVLTSLEVGTMILGESALSFLGLGVVSPDVSWGSMLSGGREYISSAWWVVAFPGLAITVTVLAINLVGDGLRMRYDPRKRTR